MNSTDMHERDHDCSPDCMWPDCPGYPGLYLVDPDGHPLAHERLTVIPVATSKHHGQEPTDD